jgi:hypothetical protein
MLQVQFDPGSTPATSTSDTSVDTEGVGSGITFGVAETTFVGGAAATDELAGLETEVTVVTVVTATSDDAWTGGVATTTTLCEATLGVCDLGWSDESALPDKLDATKMVATMTASEAQERMEWPKRVRGGVPTSTMC